LLKWLDIKQSKEFQQIKNLYDNDWQTFHQAFSLVMQLLEVFLKPL
jgi:hypothetical protein